MMNNLSRKGYNQVHGVYNGSVFSVAAGLVINESLSEAGDTYCVN